VNLDQGERRRREAVRLGEVAHSENAAMLTGSQLAMLRCEIRRADEAIAFFNGIVSRWPDYAIMARPRFHTRTARPARSIERVAS
jgi:hypothetical protein